MDEQLEFLKLIVNRLETAGVPYMLTGSMAMSVYAAPRMTRDIDLVVDLDEVGAEKFAALFAQDCYVEVETVREAIRRRDMFNIIHSEWVTKADFVIRKDTPYRVEEFGRREPVEMAGTIVYVATVEDLILSKLFWARESESELQLRDVRELLHGTSGLDQAYLAEKAEELGLQGLLRRVQND